MQYDLVFEGGGAKGMVFVGAMQSFETRGHTFGRLLGTSAGAITAALLAAGYDSDRMLEALDEKVDGKPVFSTFMGVPGPFEDEDVQSSVMMEMLKSANIPLVPERVEDTIDRALMRSLLSFERFRHLFSFVERGGWYAADAFVDWITRKLNADGAGRHTGFGAMNLSEFFEATQRELCLIASDTTAQRILVLNHRTAPKCPLVWAVRMSMSIPLVWCEVEWQAEWGQYRDDEATGHLIVDGGMLSNFPIELLVSRDDHVVELMGQTTSERVLGLLIDEDLAVPEAPPVDGGTGSRFTKLRTVQRIMSLINTMTQAHDKQVIEAFERFVARMPAQGYGTVEFDMSDGRREALIAGGRDAMEKYFIQPPVRRARGMLSEGEQQETIADKVARSILF